MADDLYVEVKEKNSSYLVQLLLLVIIFFLTFMPRVIPSPLLPVIESSMQVSHGEATSIFLFISIGYSLSVFLSGFVSSKISHRSTILFSILFLSLSMGCTILSYDFNTLRICMLIMGFSVGFYLPSAIAAIVSIVPSRHIGKSIAIHELSPNLAYLGAPLICELLLEKIQWKGIMFIQGIAALLMAFAYLLYGKGGDFKSKCPNLIIYKELFKNKTFVVVSILFIFSIAGSMGIFSVLPVYLVSEAGFDMEEANMVVALSRLPALGIIFIAGWASDRFGVKLTIRFVFLLSGISIFIIGVAPPSAMVPAIFINTISVVCFFPPAFAILAKAGRKYGGNMAVTLAVPLGILGGSGIIPNILGHIADVFSFSLGIACFGIVTIMVTFLTRFIADDDTE